ncbi:hypothetical protein BH10ACT9_BH10ACT9_21810 [soil metagenome]
MGTGWSIAVAAVFVWLGMVVGISFLEAPLKFRAPGVTPALGLGIGRLVFRALNVCEAILGVVVLAGLRLSGPALVPLLVAVATLTVQVFAVRPALSRRSDAVLAGKDGPRSQAHHAYVGLEAVKVVALITAGVVLLTQGSI